MGNLSLWQWMLALIVVFGLVVPAALAAWMIRRRPGQAPGGTVILPPERADEVRHARGVLRDLV